MLELVGLLRAHVVALSSFAMVITVVGTADQLDGAERLLRPYGMVEPRALLEVAGSPANREPEPADKSECCCCCIRRSPRPTT